MAEEIFQQYISISLIKGLRDTGLYEILNQNFQSHHNMNIPTFLRWYVIMYGVKYGTDGIYFWVRAKVTTGLHVHLETQDGEVLELWMNRVSLIHIYNFDMLLKLEFYD